MPTYDYQCRSCERVIEVIHAMTEDGPSACDACGGSLRRVLYPAGIIFKGSGFYRTDSRTNGAAAASTGSDSKPKEPAPTGGTASSESSAGTTGGGTESSKAATASD